MREPSAETVRVGAERSGARVICLGKELAKTFRPKLRSAAAIASPSRRHGAAVVPPSRRIRTASASLSANV